MSSVFSMVTEPVMFDNFSECLEPMIYEWNRENKKIIKMPYYESPSLLVKKSTYHFLRKMLSPLKEEIQQKDLELVHDATVYGHSYDQPFHMKVYMTSMKYRVVIAVKTYNGIKTNIKDIKPTQWSKERFFYLKSIYSLDNFYDELNDIRCPSCDDELLDCFCENCYSIDGICIFS
jgi:hypothetical protein